MLDFEHAIPHDAVIQEICIDRTNPGDNDCISLTLLMQDDSKHKLLFTDVYHAQLDLNFGIVAEESIQTVFLEENNIKITEIRGIWKNLGVDIDDLKCYILLTNSTNSTIKIYARNFLLENLDK